MEMQWQECLGIVTFESVFAEEDESGVKREYKTA